MIYVTGASGYLGQHIMWLGGELLNATARDASLGYFAAAGSPLIHAAWAGVPKTGQPIADQGANRSLMERVLEAKPSFIVFVSTRTGSEEYLAAKFAAEGQLLASGIPCHILRLPGLFGPPRRDGLAYNATRFALKRQPWLTQCEEPTWTTMHVAEAAALCLQLAREEKPGLTLASNPLIEEWLQFCRSDA